MSTADAASSWAGFGTAVASAPAALAALLAAIVFGLINVWVLLAEILR